MSDITQLENLPEEVSGEVNWDAPESGSFPPTIYPGVYPFLFMLPESQEDQFEAVRIDNRDYLQVNFTAAIPISEVPEERFVFGKPEGEDYVYVRFERANAYKTEKMPNHSLGELCRSLGVKVEPFTKSMIIDTLRSADGKARGLAEFKWDAYVKSDEVTITTSPRKKPKQGKKTDIPWPKDKNGKLITAATAPDGSQVYGRERINRFKLPPRDDIPF